MLRCFSLKHLVAGARVGERPLQHSRDLKVAEAAEEHDGQLGAMRETFTNISAGLLVAVVVIFLLLAATFQSLRLAFAVVSTVPAVLMGVVLMLAVTRTTPNVQSFMGAIMAIGVAVANAILLVTFAEQARVHGTARL